MISDDITPLVNLMKDLPPPVLPEWFHSDKPWNHGRMLCMCGLWKPIEELETLNTGVLNVISNVCKDCTAAKKEDRSQARIVCCGCKQVVGRMQPNITPAGFRYDRNRTYHLDKCGVCHPGLQESMILEELLFNKTRGQGRMVP